VYAPRGEEVAAIGGDFLDFCSGPNLQQLAVALGDVAGKGIEAAAMAVMAKCALQGIVATLRWPLQPGEALAEVHHALIAGRLDEGVFVTLAFALLNAKDGSLTVASAGHPAPVLLRADGRVERPLLLSSPAIGVTGEAELHALPAERLELAAGDAALFYTDGFGDARDERGRFYDETRLDEALGELRGLPAAQLAQRLHADVRDFAGRPPSDDVALVLLRRTA